MRVRFFSRFSMSFLNPHRTRVGNACAGKLPIRTQSPAVEATVTILLIIITTVMIMTIAPSANERRSRRIMGNELRRSRPFIRHERSSK